MSTTDVLQKRFAAALMPNYGLPALALVRGQGCRVWDADGREYLDLFAGIAVSALGHAHPALTEAVTRQVSALAHTSNLFMHEPGIELAEKLLALLSDKDFELSAGELSGVRERFAPSILNPNLVATTTLSREISWRKRPSNCSLV